MFRSMRRFKQQLPEAECIELLRREPRGVLSVHGEDGYPYGLPMDFVYDDGKLFFHCAREGHKLDALRRNDKASFCVMDRGYRREGEWALNIRSVIVFGRVRVLEDREETLRRVRQLGLKYAPDADYVERELMSSGAAVCCLEMTVDHMTGKLVNES